MPKIKKRLKLKQDNKSLISTIYKLIKIYQVNITMLIVLQVKRTLTLFSLIFVQHLMPRTMTCY